MDLNQLNDMFTRGVECDKSEFAKMRSSLLLIAGEHYNKRSSRFMERIRSSQDLSNEVKLRLTKNHIGRITRRYSNTIVSTAPGVVCSPANKKELQDQKSAELSQGVWSFIKSTNDWQNTVMEWSDDFVGIGEIWTKVYYDDTVGSVIGYEPMIDEMTGSQVVDEMGQLIPDEARPIKAGAVKYEEVYAFNVLRDPAAKNIKKSPWYCVRKMVSVDDLKKQFPKHEEAIQQSADETFMVFDVSSGYRESNNKEAMVREWYIRPCAKYPKGYWAIALSSVKLDEGEFAEDADGVLFPLLCERFEYVQTKPRGIAVTEPLRPYQAEINRSSSKIAEHQITLGDDKLILQNGAKMSAGTQVPGIRSVTVTGAAPTIMEGRSGSQYVEYMLSQIKEMYDIADLDDEDVTANLEPHTLLYRAASHKKKFRRYVQRFEGFLKNVCEISLRTARVFMPDEAVIQAVGRSEAVNVAEFKNSRSQLVMIKVEPQSEDIETKLGQQMVMNHVLQYVGSQMSEASIGKLVRNMPYANVEESFSDLTIDDDNATNDILALDRGQLPNIGRDENHEYVVSRLTQRMKQADFQMLSPEIQQAYQMVRDQHMTILDEQKQALQRAQAGMIPASGTLVGVDFYVMDPNNPDRTRRARLPYDAVDWLVKKLEEQSGFMSQVAQMPETVVADHSASSQMAAGPSGEMVDPLVQM